ncbi:ABC transporter ATP-binding protein [Portibacter lacus]|uniref:Multidrug ABC transporter ATP-binding protein n=1 Tax=Portibacter lacus TaxID=1099794 RepID=A0AA37SUQ0_9BACT|nr:ABC transporter transmembrane domain-containing protein [Portibacter lacus]GLR18365.1 multidrug ABC transporter ATP-binding protein [Portibacter lacus]
MKETEEKSKKLNKEQLREAWKMFKFVKPYRWYFIGGLILLFISSLLVMVFPWLAGQLIDIANNEGKYGLTLEKSGYILLIILVIQGIVSYFRVIFFAQVSERGMADVRKNLYQKLISLPVFFFEENRVGELMSRISSDVDQLQQLFSVTLAEFLRQILILVVGIAYVVYAAPQLSLVMLASFPFIVVGAVFFGRFVRKLSKKRQEELADTNVVVEESLQGIRTVKTFTNEIFEFNRYVDKIANLVKISLNLASVRALFSSFIIVVLFGGIFFIVWYGSKLVLEGTMTVGDLVSFITFMAFIGGSLGSLGTFYTQILSTLGGTERLREILNTPGEIDIDNFKEDTLDVSGRIKFNDVEFSYPSRADLPVLKGINLEVNPGEKIALVGQSGSGKSTIVQLLMRLYDIGAGSITLDEKNITEYDLTAFRSLISIVPQEVLLFGGSIKQNIAYGKPNATDEEIQHAAEQANAYEFISRFPDGFETMIGERGIKLSGGQKQRIAIARAILNDPEILILDEATSSLDSESEKLVQDALNKLMKGRTSIIIAHRLSTIVDVDQIYVLENGVIVEQGTHTELSNIENGAYSNLAKLQFQTA